MSIRKYLTGFATALAFTTVVTAPGVAAPTFTPWGLITQMQVGWVVDRMLVWQGNGPLTNPDGCSIVTNGYIINETDADHKTVYAMLLSAQLNQRRVTLLISGCYYDRPRIISVAIQ